MNRSVAWKHQSTFCSDDVKTRKLIEKWSFVDPLLDILYIFKNTQFHDLLWAVSLIIILNINAVQPRASLPKWAIMRMDKLAGVPVS